MRILLTVPCYWPAVAYGGPVQKARGLAEALAAAGEDVTVLTSNLLDLSRRLPSGTRRVGPVEVVYLHAALRYRWTPVCPGVVPWVRRNVGGFDMVHVLGYRDPIGLLAAARARRRGIPVVFEPLGMYRPASRNLALKRVFDSVLGRRMVGWADAVIANSSLERQQLEADGIAATKLAVRPNGVAPKAFRDLPERGALRAALGIPPEAPLVLFLGRISRQKGLAFLAGVLADHPDAHLVVAGPDDADGARTELLAAAERARAGSRLHLPGVLDEERRRQALAEADCLALPSSGESFGNAAAEAVVAGVPTLVTDRCGVAEFLGEAALVIPYDERSIRGGVARLLSDPDLRARLSAARPAVVERLAWDRLAGEQLALYRGLAREG